MGQRDPFTVTPESGATEAVSTATTQVIEVSPASRVPAPRADPGRHRRGHRAEAAPAASHKFRPDVEGLRAIAIGLVLIFHAGLPFVPGGFVGVDVFFVISGFLITTQLIDELDRTGRISLTGFYARRARRILPAAAVVLLATVVMVWFFVPRIRWEEIGGDILASALYVVNWRLADRSVDYLAEDSQPSPVQHFWSLAVEEQFYLVWPILMIVATLLARLLRVRARPIVWLAIASIAIPSLLWSIRETAHSPGEAFFSTSTRMWELAVGAVVALAASGLTRLPRLAGVATGWAGLVAVVASGFVYSTSSAWPSYLAALPTLGTAAVIAAGFSAGKAGPVVVLGLRPMRWVGQLSYSLYLWHWPLIVAATAYRGGLGPRSGALVIAASFIPAWLSYKLVENPIRRSPAVNRSPRLALSLGVNFTLLGVVAGLLVTNVSSRSPQPSTPWVLAPGATILGENPLSDSAGVVQDRVEFITPDPLRANQDIPSAYGDGCQQNQTDSEVVSCVIGNPESTTTVVLAGDSKAIQWQPALELLANENDWKLVVIGKSSCTLTSGVLIHDDGPYESCIQWNESLLNQLVRDPPDYVLTSGGSSQAIPQPGDPSDPSEAMIHGLQASWRALTAVGTKVIVIADNPHPGFQVYECVDEHRNELSECTYDRERRETNGGHQVQVPAVDGLPGVSLIDLWDAICPAPQCPPVIGNVLVYRQGSHLTATYVRTLTPRLAMALTQAGLPAEFAQPPP